MNVVFVVELESQKDLVIVKDNHQIVQVLVVDMLQKMNVVFVVEKVSDGTQGNVIVLEKLKIAMVYAEENPVQITVVFVMVMVQISIVESVTVEEINTIVI